MLTKQELQELKARQKERKRILKNLLKRVAIREDVEAVGGVGLPSKMPGTAYGLSALLCRVGRKLAERVGTICHKCYALRNNYTYPEVKESHRKREATLVNPEAWITAWSNIFAFLGTHLPEEERFHRWHDSGDVRDAEHLGMICEVARRNPEWRFWLPSKEYGVVRQYLAEWGKPSNLTVRMSATHLGVDATVAIKSITGNWSTVGFDEKSRCPAPLQGGFCDACRDCWEESIPSKDYKQH